jgi:hypothetical protein
VSHKSNVERRGVDKTGSDRTQYPAFIRIIVNFRVHEKKLGISFRSKKINFSGKTLHGCSLPDTAGAACFRP